MNRVQLSSNIMLSFSLSLSIPLSLFFLFAHGWNDVMAERMREWAASAIYVGLVCLSFCCCINDKKKRSHVVTQWSILFFLVGVAPICKPLANCLGSFIHSILYLHTR